MPEKSTTREDLTKVATAACGTITRAEAREFVTIFIQEMCETLERGQTLKMSGFGTFRVRAKSERAGRNPRTGQPYPISARRVLTFKPSRKLTTFINETRSRQRAKGWRAKMRTAWLDLKGKSGDAVDHGR